MITWRFPLLMVCLLLAAGPCRSLWGDELRRQLDELEAAAAELRARLDAAETTSPSGESLPASSAAWSFESTRPPATWSAGSSAHGFRVRPYGAFWADMRYSNPRTQPGAYTLWALSREVEQGDAFVIDARRSRFGLQVEAPRILEVPGRGRVEIDFHGEFVSENRAAVLLRHAYWELQTDAHRLLVGQTWDVISPRTPNMLNYSAGWTAGNIGFRRAQFRYERLWKADPETLWRAEIALNQDIVADFPAEAGVVREPAAWPVVEGRFSWRRGSGDRPLELGLSAHIGQTGFDFQVPGPPPLDLPPAEDQRYLTWSVNVDWALPLGPDLWLQGEFFSGANLSAYLGGIGQGVCPCTRVPIRSIGGWIELEYAWPDGLKWHAGFGLDDPRDQDTFFGRRYNHFVYGNITLDVTEQLLAGLELSLWKTLYQERRADLPPPEPLFPRAAGEAVVLQLMVKYSF